MGLANIFQICFMIALHSNLCRTFRFEFPHLSGGEGGIGLKSMAFKSYSSELCFCERTLQVSAPSNRNSNSCIILYMIWFYIKVKPCKGSM